MTAPHSAPPDPRRRLAVMAGAGTALGLLLFLATRVMGGGDTGEVAAVETAAPAAAPPTTVAAPAAVAGTVETFEVFTTKNPFQPLRSTSTAAATSAPTGVRATPTSTGATATPAAPAVTSGSAAPAPAAAPTTASGGQAVEPARSTRVALLDVFAENGRVVANVRVNDTVSKVAAGDTFASNFKAVSLDPAQRCGRFLYGDDQFRICRGEELLK